MADLAGADDGARGVLVVRLTWHVNRLVAGVQTLGDLVQKSDSELNAIPNFGRKSIEEVKETLEARGLSLRA